MTTDRTPKAIILSEVPAAAVMDSYSSVKAFRRAMRNLASELGTEYQVTEGQYRMYIGNFLYNFWLNDNGCTWWEILSD